MKGTIIKDMEEITEEAGYVNVPEGPADKKATGPGAAPEGAVDTKASPSGLRFFLPIAVCWIILLAIMGLRIYFTSELSEVNAKQTAEILKLIPQIQELENLTVRYDNLTQAYTVLESNNTNLSAEVQELKTRNQELENLTVRYDNPIQAYTVLASNNTNLSAEVQELKTRNQELETQNNYLIQQIKDKETNWNKLNISRTQWSIDSYCLGNTDDKCQSCQKGWDLSQPSCYAINDPPSPRWKTWEEAREDCKGKNSDLAVAHNPAEKNDIINKYSPFSSGTNGYWIGLRVEDGKWKWVDGSYLNDSSFNADPVQGRCAISVQRENNWVSVSCDYSKQWICQKKALSLPV